MSMPSAPTAVTREFASQEIRQHVLLYPSEDVVRFLAREKPHLPAQAEGLDVGFGSGRHLQLLMDYGIRAHGVDLSADALDAFRTHFPASPVLGDLVVGDLSTLNFPRDYFQVAIMWGVLFLRPVAAMKSDLIKLAGLIRPGGALCINFRTKDNWFYGLGEEIGPGYFLLDQRAGAYANALYCFVDEAEAREITEAAGLRIENFERNDIWREPERRRHSWWIVWARKPL
jgi:2-polyprenyl-3-methyl-5-hydroxy-6-metoxy-1,4-benzoquinol methylase